MKTISLLKSSIEKAGFMLLTSGVLILGFFQGFQVQRITIDLFFIVLEILWIDAFLSSIGFTAFLLVSAGLFFWRLRRSESKEETYSGKLVCIIPTYMDSNVLSRSVDSILESDYRNLEILIVCEEDDEEGIEKANSFARNEKVSYTVNDNYPGSKAGAINHGAEKTDSEFIAIFDSDQIVQDNFISKAISEIKKYEVVQGRHIPEPRGLTESMAYYESIIFNYVTRQLMQLVTGFKMVGSRSTVIRRETFEELGGYDTDTLTEDFDFANKCYRQRISAKEVLVPTNNEAAHNLRDWWGQRKRWMIGYFQVFIKSSKLLRSNYRNSRYWFSPVISGTSILGSFLMLTLVSKFLILLFLGSEISYLLPIAAILIIAVSYRLRDWRKGFVDNIGYSWIFTPVIFPFFSLITIKAFTEFVLADTNSWYRVNKTG